MENTVVTPSAVAPESSTPAVVAPQATPAVTPPNPGNPAATESREAIYQKLYGGEAPPPAAPPVVTPAQSAPAVVVPPQTPAPPPAENDRIAQLEAQLASLTNTLTTLTTPAPTAPGVVEPQKGFFELLKEGKVEEAEALMASRASAEATKRATTEALEMFRVETEVTKFIDDLRSKNAELLPLEDLITSKAASKLEVAQKSGKIKNLTDYVTQYKSAVTAATEEARTILHSIRAGAKTESLTTTKEVLGASTIPPAAVDTTRGAPATPAAPDVDSPESYIARRRALNETMRWGRNVQVA